jgi:undecaprenyl diphosphate synthase
LFCKICVESGQPHYRQNISCNNVRRFPQKTACQQKKQQNLKAQKATFQRKNKKVKAQKNLEKKIPTHIGFIMDGNGRWAKKRLMPRKFGHSEGAKSFKKIVEYCKAIKIPYITFYAFSTENRHRPADEVEALMELFRNYLNDLHSHIDEGVRLLFIGDRTMLAADIQKHMNELENNTADNNEMTLILAINYGGRADILQAFKKISRKITFGELKTEDITENIISQNLYTEKIPDIDLVIRTSGEMRLSNFLIWQTAYSEFYFTDVLWPDFSAKDLDKALAEYAKRKRKYGGI